MALPNSHSPLPSPAKPFNSVIGPGRLGQLGPLHILPHRPSSRRIRNRHRPGPIVKGLFISFGVRQLIPALLTSSSTTRSIKRLLESGLLCSSSHTHFHKILSGI